MNSLNTLTLVFERREQKVTHMCLRGLSDAYVIATTASQQLEINVVDFSLRLLKKR